MSKSITLGHVAGLRVTAFPNAFIGFLILWVVLALVAALTLTRLPLWVCIVGAFVATLLHYVSEFWHNLGHAWSARRTGYPMIGVRYWWILGASVYPKDEPPLPGSIYIRRALGGPIASLLLALVLGIIILLLSGSMLFEPPELPLVTALWYILFFVFLDNLFVFGLGAFLPLGFTDGSTILHWWGKRGEKV
jgi:hypothetical protein